MNTTRKPSRAAGTDRGRTADGQRGVVDDLLHLPAGGRHSAAPFALIGLHANVQRKFGFQHIDAGHDQTARGFDHDPAAIFGRYFLLGWIEQVGERLKKQGELLLSRIPPSAPPRIARTRSRRIAG